MWFGNLSGPKKAAAVVVAIATGVSAVVGAVNGSIALYEKLGERSRAANPLELVDVGFTQVRQKGAKIAVPKTTVFGAYAKEGRSVEAPPRTGLSCVQHTDKGTQD
jgi:hypothetical protein